MKMITITKVGTLSCIWEKYTGDRDKVGHDIVVKGGRVYPLYYPNATSWYPMSGLDTPRFTDGDVVAIRHSDHHWCEFYGDDEATRDPWEYWETICEDSEWVRTFKRPVEEEREEPEAFGSPLVKYLYNSHFHDSYQPRYQPSGSVKYTNNHGTHKPYKKKKVARFTKSKNRNK